MNYICHQKAQVLYTKLALTKTTGVFLYIVKYCLPWSNVHFSFCKCDEHKCFNRWRALSGDDYVCDCCESQCLTSKSKRAMLEGKQFLVVLYCGLIISSNVVFLIEIATFINKWSPSRIVLHIFWFYNLISHL